MPFPAGTVVLCQQGNGGASNRTHFKENNRYGLDFSNTALPSLPVLAAAPGRVAHVYAQSDPRDQHAGFGYGNHVKIEHGDSFFAMYAHLDHIVVRKGDIVGPAALIGTVGSSGAAGNRHLHFSLHRGDPSGMGVHESCPMEALVATEMGGAADFRAMASALFRDGKTDLWGGALYGSENGAGPVCFGKPPKGIDAMLAAGEAALRPALADRQSLDRVSREWQRHDSTWAREILTPILARAPRHAVARYWLATAVHMPEKRGADADAVFRNLLDSGRDEPTWESWLVSCCHSRLGVLARNEGQTGAARSHFVEAVSTAVAEPERSFALLQLSEMDGLWDGG